MIVSSNSMEQGGSINMFHQMIAQNNGNEMQNSDETQCLPPIGKRIFWYVDRRSFRSTLHYTNLDAGLVSAHICSHVQAFLRTIVFLVAV